jgi:hypothetical protein
VPTPPASPWQDEDYDVFDGDRDVGRIYVVGSYGGNETWFWGVSFQLTGRKSYGNATSLEEAKAEFRAQYERWQRERRGGVRPEARAGSRGFGKKGVAKKAATKRRWQGSRRQEDDCSERRRKRVYRAGPGAERSRKRRGLRLRPVRQRRLRVRANRPRTGIARAAEADASSRLARLSPAVCTSSVGQQSACPCSGRPASQQTAPRPCAQVRCIRLIYVENVGSQFLSPSASGVSTVVRCRLLPASSRAYVETSVRSRDRDNAA